MGGAKAAVLPVPVWAEPMHVVAGEHDWDRALLDGRGLHVAHLLDGVGQSVGQALLREGRIHLGHVHRDGRLDRRAVGVLEIAARRTGAGFICGRRPNGRRATDRGPGQGPPRAGTPAPCAAADKDRLDRAWPDLGSGPPARVRAGLRRMLLRRARRMAVTGLPVGSAGRGGGGGSGGGGGARGLRLTPQLVDQLSEHGGWVLKRTNLLLTRLVGNPGSTPARCPLLKDCPGSGRGWPWETALSPKGPTRIWTLVR